VLGIIAKETANVVLATDGPFAVADVTHLGRVGFEKRHQRPSWAVSRGNPEARVLLRAHCRAVSTGGAIVEAVRAASRKALVAEKMILGLPRQELSRNLVW
jgi:hypothetical protein